ncbi:hypothetical protein B0T26DRAFT_754389 [Lasiosphaeria miniovina]|uniref:Uncharacterized protein n=1 Tax=Lasiosphaeria miniovina TaxID=1954250 RepID=A0AA40A4G5_9PEZI|nr:uncharacterized protein B0T26DRAFT_754389 [Lasiosphaeria miniovina]KAK0709133.1 hypothetical protein B0T26DRAFT_754389 [Lasiosphaeria miniovina]
MTKIKRERSPTEPDVKPPRAEEPAAKKAKVSGNARRQFCGRIIVQDYDIQIAVFANSLYHARDVNDGYALVFKQPDGAQIVLAWPLYNTGEDALQGIAVAQAIEVAGKVVRAWTDKYVENLGGRMLNFVARARVLVFSDNKTMLDVLDWRAAAVSAVHYKVVDIIIDKSYEFTHMPGMDNRTFAIFDGEHGILAMLKGVYENLGEEIKALEAMFPKPPKPASLGAWRQSCRSRTSSRHELEP